MRSHWASPNCGRRFPASLKGARLDQLIHAAQQLGFRSRALRLEVAGSGQAHPALHPALAIRN